MEWYQIVNLVVGLLGIGSIISFFIKEAIMKKKTTLNRGSKEERKEEIIEAIKPLFDKLEEQNKELKKDIKEINEDIQLLKSGEQATLRHNLLEIYNVWQPRGYCPQDVKDDFENQYQKYHKLGANGVMDHYRNALIDLPVTRVDTRIVLKETRERE